MHPAYVPPSDPGPGPGEKGNFPKSRSFAWLNGDPLPAVKRKGQTKNLLKEQLIALHTAALSLPYKGVYDPETGQYCLDDPDFEGMTLGEAMVLRQGKAAANGDPAAYATMMDRICGKPKQQIEAAVSTMSYTEFLDSLAREDTPGQTPPVVGPAIDLSLNAEIIGGPDDL